MCFLFLLPNYIHIYAITIQYNSYIDKREVLRQEYSRPQYFPLLTSDGFKALSFPTDNSVPLYVSI